jgi:mRNA-degrading endonuclease RelE of RelBE toxin-antitoxin system
MNSNANWGLKIKKEVYKELSKIPGKERERIAKIIEIFSINPYLGDIEKMKGEENVWRRRAGAYRIFYELIPKTKIIYVFRVERRTSKTY